MIKVLIADDHPPFTAGLMKLLSEEPDLKPVGSASDGEEAIRLAQELKPDVVVMDIAMPKLNGIEATRRIKSESPQISVLVLSAYGYLPYVVSALEAGAGGYLLKSVPLRELLNGIRAIRLGEAVLDRAVAQKILYSLAKPMRTASAGSRLTAKEVDVLKAAAHGSTNKEMAQQLFLSERTVQSYFTSIFAKLGVGSRLEAVVKGLKEGWIVLEDIS
jgi:NarL family two-component system response regulator LiaR